MCNTFLIDPFATRMTNEEAARYFKSYVRYNRKNELIYGEHLILEEKKILKFFLALFYYEFGTFKLIVNKKVKAKFGKTRLTKQENKLLKIYGGGSLVNSPIKNPSIEEVFFWMKIACREIVHITVASRNVSIKSLGEFCFAVKLRQEVDFEKVFSLLSSCKLFVRHDESLKNDFQMDFFEK